LEYEDYSGNIYKGTISTEVDLPEGFDMYNTYVTLPYYDESRTVVSTASIGIFFSEGTNSIFMNLSIDTGFDSNKKYFNKFSVYKI
jgi:hypothetical protein